MPNHLSTLGIIHTVISVFALFAGANCLFNDGRIIPSNSRGRSYIWLTTLTCLTSFPIMKTGHFTNAHALGVIVLVLLIIGTYIKSIGIFKKIGDYLQTVSLSATLFLSFIPATVETLTRLPISHPLASGPGDPLIQKCLSILALCFLVGVIYQMIKIRSSKKSTPTAGDVKLG